MRLLSWLAANVVAVAVAAWLVEGIHVDGPSRWPAQLEEKWLTVVAVGVILGLVSRFVKPVIQILSIPFIIVTLGLFLWVINAGMLMFTGWLAEQLGLGFHVDDFFWAALLGALVISVVNWVLAGVLDDD